MSKILMWWIFGAMWYVAGWFGFIKFNTEVLDDDMEGPFIAASLFFACLGLIWWIIILGWFISTKIHYKGTFFMSRTNRENRLRKTLEDVIK
jgi:hypothetical protein